MSSEVLYETQKIVKTNNTERIKITKPEDIYNLKQIEDIRGKLQEHLIVIALNGKNIIDSIELVGIGNANCISARPADILRCALIRGSRGIIVAHNHPTGDNKPSKIDIEFTNKLNGMASALGIEMFDHIIVGDECLSMREQKYIKENYDSRLQENEAMLELKEQNSNLQKRIDVLEKRLKTQQRKIQEEELEMEC